MAVISDYEEEEQPMQQQTQPTPSPQPVNEPPPVEEVQQPPPVEEVQQPPPVEEVQQPPSPPSTPAAAAAAAAAFQHDPVLVSLLEDHKRRPLELLTTVIDFLFRETDLSRESRVEHRVSEIVTAAKRRRTAYDGEDAAPVEKVAKVEEESNNNNKPVVKSTTVVKTKEAEEQPEIIDESEGTGLTPNIGNGYDHETYSWSQTLCEVTVHIKLPVGSKAKGVACEIKGKTLKAGLKDQDPILQGEFYTPVKSDDCFWSLEDDGTLSIYVTKCNNRSWWGSVLKGEPEINTRKVMPENSRLDELDSETRSTAEKLMYDQRQKAMGLPTSDESGKSEAIKKFMAQHPEMDFSKAKIC